MKKLFAMLMALMVSAAMFTGCGGGDKKANTDYMS